MDPRVPSTQLSPEEQRPIDAFVQASPNSNYHIVEPVKGEPKVQLCRVSGEVTAPGGAQRRECTQIAQDVTKVFAFMSERGFFCQLPFDPTHTEIECVRINKIVQRQS
ncbi:hypothetical protein BMF94_3414 [Rhodotorula taiwanensis]|uniref:Uncharacterized protein n=1 Tax=Rhodotorula taiwanensis TaxID=741276 RepID=A0A2S5B9N0_9BASI|nr:hypothetical protein BMF94_3414 [Rhodotorula taiwanensis]